MPDHLGTHVQRRFSPRPALATPAMIDHVLGHLDRRRRRQLDHLPTACHTHSSQPTATHRTRPDQVLYNLGRLFSTPCAIIPGIALLAGLLFLRLRLLHMRFHKRRWRRFLLFQFLDTLVSCCQRLVQQACFGLFCAQPLQQLAFPLL
ncbi:MAG: hypothetical protein ACXVCM_17920 [Ktedonobacteraceae bacterium]